LVKVSVIIPNYNHAAFLKQRIDSVLNQTYPDFEIILLDDASTDGSADLLLTYQEHEKVSHVVINRQNSGSTFVQWQRGLALAQGEYVWIAESDDYCSPDLLEELVALMEMQADVTIAFCNSIMFRDNEVLTIGQSGLMQEITDGKKFIADRMLFGNTIYNASMAIFKRAAANQVDFSLIQTFKFCGDWLFWIQLAQLGQVGSSAKVLNYFRKHNADVSGRIYLQGQFHQEFYRAVGLLQKQHLVDTLKSRYLYYKEWLRVDMLIQDPAMRRQVKRELRSLMFGIDTMGERISLFQRILLASKLVYSKLKLWIHLD
jgi:glycosyltransferase involved in cell wall biosynthesis